MNGLRPRGRSAVTDLRTALAIDAAVAVERLSVEEGVGWVTGFEPATSGATVRPS